MNHEFSSVQTYSVDWTGMTLYCTDRRPTTVHHAPALRWLQTAARCGARSPLSTPRRAMLTVHCMRFMPSALRLHAHMHACCWLYGSLRSRWGRGTLVRCRLLIRVAMQAVTTHDCCATYTVTFGIVAQLKNRSTPCTMYHAAPCSRCMPCACVRFGT